MNHMKIKSELGHAIEMCEKRESNFTAVYTLYESEFTIDSRHVYSLCVETISDAKNDVSVACDISRTKAIAAEIYRKISTGFVTSCALYEILEDIL